MKKSKTDYLHEFDPRNGSLGPFAHFMHFFPTKHNDKYGTYRFGFKGVEVSELIRDSSKVKLEEGYSGYSEFIPVCFDIDQYLIRNNITVDDIDWHRDLYCRPPENESPEEKSQREGKAVEFFKSILVHIVEEKGHDPEFLFK